MCLHTCPHSTFVSTHTQTLARGITKAGVQTEMLDLLSVDPQV